MSDMIERMVEAMIAAAQPQRDFEHNPYYAEELEMWRPVARAAIAAMCLPTNDMLDAGQQFVLDEIGEPDMDSAAYCWQAMINAALGEPHDDQG